MNLYYYYDNSKREREIRAHHRIHRSQIRNIYIREIISKIYASSNPWEQIIYNARRPEMLRQMHITDMKRHWTFGVSYGWCNCLPHSHYKDFHHNFHKKK